MQKKIYANIEIKRKILKVETITTKKGETITRVIVKLHTPLFEAFKTTEIVEETKDSILWGTIWIPENISKNLNIKKDDYIVVYGTLSFSTYKGKIYANINATEVKEIEPHNIIEKHETIIEGSDIPF